MNDKEWEELKIKKKKEQVEAIKKSGYTYSELDDAFIKSMGFDSIEGRRAGSPETGRICF